MSDFLEAIRKRGIGALDKKMGIEIIEASPERLVGTMPVEGNTQPIGLLHGGANVVLAESLGSIGTQLHAGADRKIVGIDINATHHKSATTGVFGNSLRSARTPCKPSANIKGVPASSQSTPARIAVCAISIASLISIKSRDT